MLCIELAFNSRNKALFFRHFYRSSCFYQRKNSKLAPAILYHLRDLRNMYNIIMVLYSTILWRINSENNKTNKANFIFLVERRFRNIFCLSMRLCSHIIDVFVYIIALCKHQNLTKDCFHTCYLFHDLFVYKSQTVIKFVLQIMIFNN